MKAKMAFMATYNMDRFRKWIQQANDMGLTEKAYIMAGITPLKSARAAHFMADDVPGVVIPDEVLKRMDNAEDQQEEGVACVLLATHPILALDDLVGHLPGLLVHLAPGLDRQARLVGGVPQGGLAPPAHARPRGHRRRVDQVADTAGRLDDQHPAGLPKRVVRAGQLVIVIACLQTEADMPAVRQILRAAAFTYVAGALVSLLNVARGSGIPIDVRRFDCR